MSPGHIPQDRTEDVPSLESELDRLSTSLKATNVDFKAFWDQVKQLNMVIRNATVVPRERRDAFRVRLDEICAEAKQHRKNAAEDRERRQAISKNKRSLVEMKIREAHGYAKGGRDSHDLRKARVLLQEAREWMRSGWGGFNATTQMFALDDGRMLKVDYDACSERWQEADRAIEDRRRELGDYNFSQFESHAEETIGIAEQDPKAARERVQAIRERMKGRIMSDEQYGRVRYLLDKAWKSADAESDSRRHEAIRRKRELIGKVMNEISSIEDQIDHYRGEEANARTSSFAASMREKIEIRHGWIEQKQAFIRELENQIREIHSQLTR